MNSIFFIKFKRKIMFLGVIFLVFIILIGMSVFSASINRETYKVMSSSTIVKHLIPQLPVGAVLQSTSVSNCSKYQFNYFDDVRCITITIESWPVDARLPEEILSPLIQNYLFECLNVDCGGQPEEMRKVRRIEFLDSTKTRSLFFIKFEGK